MIELLEISHDCVDDIFINPKVRMLMNVTVSDNGAFVTRTEFKDISISDTYGQFKSSDFSLKSILTTGSVSLLKPSVMRNSDIAGVSDQLENIKTEFDNSKTE